MADFFSNLLLRSNAPTSGAILQPRLPSLFESPHGVDELPTPPADKAHGDVSTPGPFPAPIDRAGQAALPGKPATERTPSTKRRAASVFESNTVMAAPPLTGNPSVQASPEFGRTILPEGQQETIFSARPAVETDNAPILQGSGQDSQPGTQLTNENPAVRESMESRQAARALTARNILQPPTESTIYSSAHKPVLTPQPNPAAPASRQIGAQPEQQAAQNERVVQVHIGRIEVRAVHPAPAPSQPVRNSPAAKTKMSLEDYLRQREEKR